MILCAGRVVRKSWLVSVRAKEQQRSIIILYVVRGCGMLMGHRCVASEKEVRSTMIESAPRCEVWQKMLGKKQVLCNNNDYQIITRKQRHFFGPLKSCIEFFRASFTYLSLTMDLATRPPLFAHRGTERVSETRTRKNAKTDVACQLNQFPSVVYA